METILCQGAEAIIVRKGDLVYKSRIPKTYRHKQIDERIRRSRSKREAKALLKARELGVQVPTLHPSDDRYTLILDYIKGKRLRDVACDDSPSTLAFFKEVGVNLCKLHSVGLIHGDLTTSNIMIGDKLYFIDFGLSFFSDRVEDLAVDIHVFEEALESTHHLYVKKYFEAFLSGYKSHSNYENIIKRLEIVRGRGRNKK